MPLQELAEGTKPMTSVPALAACSNVSIVIETADIEIIPIKNVATVTRMYVDNFEQTVFIMIATPLD